MWWCLGTSSHSLPLVLQVMVISSFFRFLVQLSWFYLEAFSSYDFFKLYISIKFWMSNFHWFRPCGIWSYGPQDIAPRRAVTQCRIYGRYHWVLFVRDGWDLIIQAGLGGSLQFLLNWYSFLLEVGPKTTFFTWKIVKHLIRVLKFFLISCSF